ncbi:hypothetical protein [Bradyrhizobium sp. 141]|uniref:hypothetical protein n=1 Tax=Bradyrhizobium sp. 141 TaxID=2782617 RepID=UPI001FF7720F|nr:hypothetical protein [Bradyrhizobium sp. 141]MCK1722035.1 hypothetical protein [Bradyrhizobium sp. 141]
MDVGRGGMAGGPQPKHHESDVDRQPNQHCGNDKMDHGQTSRQSLDQHLVVALVPFCKTKS